MSKNNTMSYRGYTACIEFDAEDSVLFGRVIGTSSLLLFECPDPANVEKTFHAAIDEYLKACEDAGIEPVKTYSGSFNVRVPKDVHARAAELAAKSGISLNALVAEALERELALV